MALFAYVPLCVLLRLLHDYFCMVVCVLALFLRTHWSGKRSRAACSCAAGVSAQRPFACLSLPFDLSQSCYCYQFLFCFLALKKKERKVMLAASVRLVVEVYQGARAANLDI